MYIYSLQQIMKGSDILMGEFGYTANRNKLMDHVLPTRITSMALLIPKPSMQKKHYALAIINPFQIQVLSHDIDDE